jgi:hypothetical protein
MNLDKMFSMFKITEEETKVLYDEQRASYKNHAHFYLGLFYKMINREDTIAFAALIQSLHVDDNTQADIITVSKYLTYNHAYNYLATLKLNNKEHLEQLAIYDNSEFKQAVDKALTYFIQEEEYEKCTFLKTVLEHTSLSSK